MPGSEAARRVPPCQLVNRAPVVSIRPVGTVIQEERIGNVVCDDRCGGGAAIRGSRLEAFPGHTWARRARVRARRAHAKGDEKYEFPRDARRAVAELIRRDDRRVLSAS